LVGEVWLASGQSNMAMMVRTPGTQYGRVIDADAEVAAANYPTIRMFTTRYVGRDKPLDDAAGMWADEPAWRVCTPQKADRYSAAAYFFARELHKALGVPVGIINSSVGMLGAACFTSREALLSEPELRYYVDEFDRKVASYPEDKARYERELEEWKAAAAQAEAEGKPKPPAPKGVADPRTSLFVTCNAYNGMIAPLAPYAVKGAIWYQGESDSIRPEQYRTLFPLMIRDWRRTWNNDDLFFLFVQLANADLTDWKPLVWDSWPRLREAQLMTLSVPKTGMAVAIDIGDPKDLHAPNKQDVGRRLALAAQGVVYGRDIVYSGPIYERMTVEGGRIRLFFKHLGSGLVAKTPGGDLRADAPLQTFTIAAAEGEFAPAQARIDGDTVVVWSDSVARPAAVRYAWSNDPVGCNLYNKAALPASPFRTSR
jgi:sialate O-acetylesterase